MNDKELAEIYDGTARDEPIGSFRVRIGTYNQDTSFPINLSQSDFDLLYDISRYLSQENASLWINIEKE